MKLGVEQLAHVTGGVADDICPTFTKKCLTCSDFEGFKGAGNIVFVTGAHSTDNMKFTDMKATSPRILLLNI